MTTAAIYAAVFGVVKIRADVLCRINNPIRRTEDVTGRTRTDVFLADDLVRSVALKTGCVRVAARWNGHSDSLSLMASCTIRFLEMRCVIKFRPKTFHRREWF